MSNAFIIYKLFSCHHLVTMVSSPGNQSDLPTSPGEVSVGVVIVVTSCVVCKYLVGYLQVTVQLAKVRDISPSSTPEAIHLVIISSSS